MGDGKFFCSVMFAIEESVHLIPRVLQDTYITCLQFW